MNNFFSLIRSRSSFVPLKMKWFVPFIILCFPVCHVEAETFVLTETDKKCLEQFREPIRLVYAYDFFYLESSDGKRSGALSPIIELLEKKFGLKVETRKTRRDEALQLLENAEADLYGFAGVAPNREDGFLSTPALLRTEGAVVSHRDAPIRSPLNLRGKRIGVFKNALIEQPIRHYAAPDGIITEFASLPEMIAALEKKEIDCFAVINIILAEILNHPFIQYDFTLSNFTLEMGLIGNNKKMEPLIDLIRRYAESFQGDDLKNGIVRQRNETIIQVLQKHLKADIDFVRQNYDLIKIYDCCVLYPLCFKREKKQEGCLVDICNILTRLTDVPYKIDEWNCGEDGLSAALKKIKNDEIHFTSGGYANLAQWEKDGFSWSLPVCQDTIRPYSYKKNIDIFNNVRVACPPNVVPYFQWGLISDKSVQVMKTRRGLFEALKKNECDAVFIGEMNFNYRSAVLNQYDLYENDELSAESEMRLISGPQHAALNRLMDKSIQMYPILNPNAMEHWKEKAERIKTDHIRHRESEIRKYLYAGAVILVLLSIILLLLYHFMRYDWQIKRLLRKQQTFDLAWGNLRKKHVISKGDHPLYKKWGFHFNGPTCSFDELSRIFDVDRESEFCTAMNRMKEEGNDLLIRDQSVRSPIDGMVKHYRRFMHRLSNNRFMLCTQDITAQVAAEQQEQFLVELFEVMRDGFVFLDNEMNVLHYSKAVMEIFPNHDLTKKFCFEAFRKCNSPCADCPVLKSLNDGKKHSKTEYIESSKKWIEIISYPVKDTKTGEVNRVLEFLHDITEQHDREDELRKQKLFLEAIFNASDDGIIAISPGDRKGLLANVRADAVLKECDVKFVDIADEDHFENYKNIVEEPEKIVHAIRQLKKDPTKAHEGILFFHSGRIVLWRAVGVKTEMGETGWTHIWTFRNITENYHNVETIRKNEERFRQLYTSMSNALVLLDVVRDEFGKVVDFIVAYANPAFENYINHDPESIVGEFFLELVKDYRIELVGLDEKWWVGLELAANGTGGVYHCILHDFPGSPYHKIIVSPCGENQIALLLYDETYRIRMQESLLTMRVVIDHLSDPVLWIYMNGTIQYVNSAAATLFGYDSTGVKPDGPVGEKIWMFDQSLSEEKWPDFIEYFNDETTCRIETDVLTKQGKIIPMTIMLDHITQQDEPFLVACLHDLSEQTKRIEIEQAALAKNRFLDRMSQELRTPINGIVGLVNILRAMNLDSKQQGYVELIRSSGIHLLTLVNKVLDYSKINSGKIDFNFSDFDLLELTDSVLGGHAAQATKQHLEMFAFFRSDVPQFLIGDADRLRELLILLFGNALQITREGGIKLTVSLEYDSEIRQAGDSDKPWSIFRFEVEDTGVGLPQEMLDRLYDLPMTEGFSGDGLGLALGRQLVELMGGKVGLQSRKSINEKGGWSNFWFTLPFHFNEAENKTKFSETLLHLSDEISLTFAVGNAWLRENIIEQFKVYNMEIRIFSEISKTLKTMRQDVQEGKLKQFLIVDMNLKDGTATDLIDQIRNDLLLDEARVALLCPIEEDQAEIDLLNDKFDRLIGKPLIGPIFVETVYRLIEEELRDYSGKKGRNSIEKNESDSESRPISYEQQRKKWRQLSENESEAFILNGLYQNEIQWSASKETSDTDLVSEQPPTILVVEDHHVNRIVAGEILKQAGFRFEFAENGLQACNAVVAKKYSLILMDCQMPVMSGFEAARKIRVMEAGLDDRKPKHFGRIPIIALTGNSRKEEVQRCFTVGMDAFCAKPINSKKLIEEIRRWLPEQKLFSDISGLGNGDD